MNHRTFFNNTWPALVFAVFLTAIQPAFSQDAPKEESTPGAYKTYMNIGEVVVREKSGADDRIDLPGSVDVIGADELKYENVDNSLELLRKLPGISIGDYGNGGVPNGFTLRGHDNNSHGSHTVVTVDGIPINSHMGSADGAPDLNQLTPEEIERVELIKGPIDARYGNWSLAGILHYYTRTSGNFNKARISYGSFGHRKAYASLGSEHNNNKFNQIYSIEYYDAEGWRKDAERERQNAYAKWYYRPNETLKIGFHSHIYNANWETAGYLPETYWREDPRQAIPTSEDDGGYKDLTEGSFHLDWKPNKRMTIETKLWSIHDEYSRYADWGSGQTESHWTNDTYGFLSNIRNGLKIPGNQYLQIDVGLDYRIFKSDGEKWNTTARSRDNRIAGDSGDGKFDFINYGVYAKALYEPFSSIRLFLGIRQDEFNGESKNHESSEKKKMEDIGVTTYKIGIIMAPLDTISFYGNAATTFKLPDTTEKYENDATEKDYFFREIGCKFQPFEKLLFRYAYFDQEEDGLGLVDGEWVSEGDARRKGHEAELNVYPGSSLELFISYTRHDTEYEDGDNSGNELKNVPEYHLKMGAQYTLPWQSTEIRAWYNDTGMWYTNPENTHSYNGYEIFDLKIIQSISEFWQLSIDIKNVFDKTYSEFVGFWSDENQYAGSNARSFYVTLTYDI